MQTRPPRSLPLLLACSGLALSALACNLPRLAAPTSAPAAAPTSAPATVAAPSQPPPTTPAVPASVSPAAQTPSPPVIPSEPSPTLPAARLDNRPLYWFAPLPPLPTGPGREYTGSDDFMQLFEPAAPWTQAASRIQVFKLYGEWVAYAASDLELRQAVEGVRRLGLALAVEAGPLSPSAECGQGVESFAGLEEGLLIARRIQQAGGQLDLLALDEPYYYGHFYDGPGACRWTDEKIIRQIVDYVNGMRLVFPDLRVGDTEPLAGPAGAPQYQAWLVAFKAVAGYDLDFLHLDIDWSRPDWTAEAKAVMAFGEQRGTPVGVIYTGNPQDASDQAWVSICGERIKRFELENGAQPAQVVFQSWNDKPDAALPESDPFSFTGLIAAYFNDKASLGFAAGGRGANLAYHKTARYSSALPGYPGGLAVDGDPGTLWNSGAGPVQWIEIDLGAVYSIQSIRLLVSQYPAGETVHRVRGRGADPDAPYVTLYTFSGATADNAVLQFTPPQPWSGVRYVRIETLESPSWVAWREIEVYDAGAP